MISQSTIDRIKDLDIHTVVSHYVELKKRGANYIGKSPWNPEEKTPSFNVVPSRGIFKDFSADKAGDGIKFVMEYLGLSFPDAIKEIAGKCGERVEYDEKPTDEQRAESDRRELLYKVNEAASRKYHAELLAIVRHTCELGQPFTHPALEEIVKRQYTIDTIMQWQIGYAPGNVAEGYKPLEWRYMTDLVGSKSYKEALDVGLIQTKKGHTYDVFRHRVMYPVHDHHGRIVAFGGRALHTNEFNAKYINTAASPIYNKEKTLFGLHFAAQAIRKEGVAYLMEGYCDVISMHQAGKNMSVGTCGTALTEGQCALLRKYTNKVVLFYDCDKAGQSATLRAIDLLAQQGLLVWVVPMPEILIEGQEWKVKDPDELVRYFKQVA